MTGKCKVAIPRSAAASLEALIKCEIPGPPPPAHPPPPPPRAAPPLGVVAVGLGMPCPLQPPPGLRLMTLPMAPLLPLDFDHLPSLEETLGHDDMAALNF
jgi:hypothetical protein